MEKRKALIVTYYWPPAGGPGVQRWLKFSKYLPEFGVKPIVYTPENPSYPQLDESLLKEVSKDIQIIKTKIWEPYQIAEFLHPKSKDYKAGHFEKSDKQSFLTKLSVFVRGNFFVPDARKYWIRPSVDFLKKYLKENEIHTLITTGPPHSLHLIGMHLKQANPELKWLADFRDPWTKISYHSELKLTKWARKKHEILEEKTMKLADVVIASSFTDAEDYKKIGAKRVEVITNGFEEEDFKNLKNTNPDSTFKITYSGGLEIARNPRIVWMALKEIIDEYQDFKNQFRLVFYGEISHEVRESLDYYGLSNYIDDNGYVSHRESIKGICDSSLLLLTNFPERKSRGIIPGKLFEYLATQNPILAVGPNESDVERILSKTQGGRYFTYDDKEGAKQYILSAFKNRNHEKTDFFKEIQNYSRRNLTKKLAELI